MPPYNYTPGSDNTPVQMLQPGVPQFAFGSLNYSDPGTRMVINGVSIDGSGNATLYVTITEGHIPQVGALMNVEKTTLQSGVLNGNGFAITGVTINASTGKGTIVYAPGGSSQATTAQSGLAFVPPEEIPEACTTGPSQAFAVQAAKGQGRGMSWTYEFPTESTPDTFSIQLEGAVRDNDAEYTIIGTAQTDTNSFWHTIIASVPENVNFVRLNITSSSGGTSPLIAAKISQS